MILKNFEVDSGGISRIVLYDKLETLVSERDYTILVEKTFAQIDLKKFIADIEKFEIAQILNFQITHSPKEGPWNVMMILKTESAVALLNIYAGGDRSTIYAWAKTVKQAEDLTTNVIKAIPTAPAKTGTPFSFWYFEAGQAMCRSRTLMCPPYEAIKNNYSTSVQQKMEWVHSLTNPISIGKILVWHGPPGTGKTHMIRAFAERLNREKNFTIEVVIDPEVLFNNPGYYYNVLLREVEGPRLIIVEDHAELFSKEGGCRLSPGFSRLLNVTDGLLGQGQELLFLFTANEPVENIDEALLRSGRCLMNQEFPALEVPQANQWLKDHKVEETVTEPTVLSDLYAKLNSKPTTDQMTEVKSGFGFGSPRFDNRQISEGPKTR